MCYRFSVNKDVCVCVCVWQHTVLPANKPYLPLCMKGLTQLAVVTTAYLACIAVFMRGGVLLIARSRGNCNANS